MASVLHPVLDCLPIFALGLKVGGPAHGAPQVQVWSIGQTLAGWAAALRAAGCTNVLEVAWTPRVPQPEQWPPRGRERKEEGTCVDRGGVVRLFAFGKAVARKKVRAAVRDWDPRYDWFVG